MRGDAAKCEVLRPCSGNDAYRTSGSGRGSEAVTLCDENREDSAEVKYDGRRNPPRSWESLDA